MYKCIVFGGNGNIGRTVVDCLLKCNNYIEIAIIYRNKLQRWNNKTKLKLIPIESFDFLNDNNYIEVFNNIIDNAKDYNTVFCCLGGRTDSEYEKIDYETPLKISKICEALNIAHLSIISTENSDSNSTDNFLRFRGRMEEEIFPTKIKCISFFKTNYVTHQEEPSFYQCIISFFCCCKANSIECKKIGKAMVVNDLQVLKDLYNKGDESIGRTIRNYYTNDDIKKLALINI